MIPVFVVGDVHGHLDRLKALLVKAGIIGEDGVRTKDAAVVVQVGDLTTQHFMTADEDLECAKGARSWIDIQLWGNHDFTAFEPTTTFRGFMPPLPETAAHLAASAPRFAVALHGWLITHAGLAKKWAKGKYLKTVEDYAEWLNGPHARNARLDIGRARGGVAEVGGIMWRDAHDEPDLVPIPQIFGHTKHAEPWNVEGTSWCIDVAGIADGKLAGIWLPSQEIVQIKLEA